jgi:PKD repeat protein
MDMKGVLNIGMIMLAATLLVLPVSGAFAVTGIDPDRGNNTGWVYVDLSGTDLPVDFSVNLTMAGDENIPGQFIRWYDAAWISCFFDLNGKLAGERTLVVVNNTDGSSATFAGTFSVENPPPTITAVNPKSGFHDETNLALTLQGNNFMPGARVNLTNGTSRIPATVSGITTSQIACSIDLTGSVTGLWSVEVTNTDGKSALLADAFSVVNPAPVLMSIAPDTGKNDATPGAFELTGTGFSPGASVALMRTGETSIGPVGSPVVINPAKIQCMFNLTGARVGDWDVVVTNPDLQYSTLPGGFFITYPTAPKVLGITPSGGVNTGMATISNLTGTGFEEGASVLLMKTNEVNITSLNTTVTSPTVITCDLNLAGAAEGLWDVMVINNDGQSGVLKGVFQVRFPGPQITGISPSVGLNNGTVFISDLSGYYFRSPATVKLTCVGENDIPAANVTVVNSNKITCDFALAGKNVSVWNLVVTNPDGQNATSPNLFKTENAPPHPFNITPVKGPNDRAVFISALNGTGFLPGATVQLTRSGQSPINATGVSVQSPSKINCTLNLAGKATGKWNVVVTNTDGKSDLIPNGFTITLPPPVPNFTASPVFGTAPLTVQFSDISTNDPFLWSWNFGDGFTSTGLNQQSSVHTYNEPGVYNVSLRVRNEGGEVEVTKTNCISVVLTPVASFTAEPKSGHAPLLVQFTDTSDGNPAKYNWKFGDGGISTEKNPYHLYTTPGTYTVSLSISNKAGSDTKTITDLITVTSLPVAEFSANVTSGQSPLAVKFNDISTGHPTSWLWKFGDGGNSTEQNPVHVFADQGTYSVQLTASNDEGTSTVRKDGYVVVGQGIHADFEYTTSNSNNAAPLIVAFADRSTGKVSTWSWKFGDRYTSDDRNPIHYYSDPGTYNVTLYITGPSGSDSVTKTIVVKSPLKADFNADPTAGSAPLTVMFSDVSVGTVAERTWIISKDPNNIIFNRPGEKNQLFTFNEPGLYSVTMNVVDSFGEKDSKVRTAYINVLPFPQ